MKIRLFLLGIGFFIIAVSWGSRVEAFEIQFPGEDGFFIGKPMVYVVTASSDEKSVGQEGTFTFGAGKVTIGKLEYYDCVFDSPSGLSSHFYIGIEPTLRKLTQKGIKVGESDLSVEPAVIAFDYPLSPGKTWSETTDLTFKNLQLPDFGLLPGPITVKGVKTETKVYSKVVAVPAGTFDALLVETTYSGSLLGIPVTLVQRTWLGENNVPLKRNFGFVKEFAKPPTELMLYEIQYSRATKIPGDLNGDDLVNILDLVIVAKYFGEKITKPLIPSPDIDGNGVVDTLDLAGVIARLW